jgi:hypothetical protein
MMNDEMGRIVGDAWCRCSLKIEAAGFSVNDRLA